MGICRPRTWRRARNPSARRLRGWEGSPEHKRNLLLPSAEAVGVAVSYRGGRAYYTLVLGGGLRRLDWLLSCCEAQRRTPSSPHRGEVDSFAVREAVG